MPRYKSVPTNQTPDEIMKYRKFPEWLKEMTIRIAKEENVPLLNILHDSNRKFVVAARNRIIREAYSKKDEYPDLTYEKLGTYFKKSFTTAYRIVRRKECYGIERQEQVAQA